MSYLILVRHGQSVWNLEKKFTGWVDVDLTENGKLEAKKSGELIKSKNIEIDIYYSSFQLRAKNTLNLIKEILNDKKISKQAWQLNERHYGSLTGLNKDEMFNLSELIEQAVIKYNNKNILKDLTPRVYFNGRKNLINRCINNIIDNALKYGNKVQIKFNKKNTNLLIIIDDDGPGIPKKEYENVFKPFYKIDKSRADAKSSVGLGLSIASDIIRSHGGNIVLDKSKLNGLSVKIFLPV